MRDSPRHRFVFSAPMPTAPVALLRGALGWAACLLLALVPSALAVDGVVEINQVRALAGGVTAGDTAGFPVTISRAGSYRLTGNLDVRSQPLAQDVTAIYVTAPNVTIDLNGFAVIGPAICSGVPATCGFGAGASGVPLPGTGIGINGNGRPNTAVFGGTIRGMGWKGLDLGEGAIVRDLLVTGNFLHGMRLGAHGIVTGCIVSANGANGVFVKSPGAGVVLAGNTLRGNGGAGITAGPGAAVWRNTTQHNGGSGIFADEGSAVLENASRLNATRGLNLIGAAGYGRNVISANLTQTVQGGVEIGGNVCDASDTCP